jgi:hypothetical protein
LLKKILNHPRYLSLINPLGPAPERDRILVSDLRADLAEAHDRTDERRGPATDSWVQHQRDIAKLLMAHDPRYFLRWSPIAGTMFVDDADFLGFELSALRAASDWGDTWAKALVESRAGCPPSSRRLPSSSGNLIHHAFHLLQLTAEYGIRIGDLKTIFEFGGGYGSMCRLCWNLGFRGRYVIFDLPLFSALQRYYLRSLGIPVSAVDPVMGTDANVFCFSQMDRLEAFLAAAPLAPATAFIATWSLSEAPPEARESFLPCVSSANYYVIAYQDRFGDIDNSAYFARWRAKQVGVAFVDRTIEHIPGNHYLLGHSVSSTERPQ